MANDNAKNNENVQNNNEQMALDDANRVRVLSPGMMVFKRFVRNRLAIVGMAIIVFMFLFSFVGGLVVSSMVYSTGETVTVPMAGFTFLTIYALISLPSVTGFGTTSYKAKYTAAYSFPLGSHVAPSR